MVKLLMIIIGTVITNTAIAQNTLNIHTKKSGVISISFADKPVISFPESDALKVVSSKNTFEYSFKDIDKLSFLSPQIDTDTRIELSEGWNWMSHNQQESMLIESLASNALSIVGQTEESNKSASSNWEGNLKELQPMQMYKVKMSQNTQIQLSGSLYHADIRYIPLYQGWNWIGYPAPSVMSLTEALSKLKAEEGDVILGQSVMSFFSDGAWVGTLADLVPGQGYMYRSLSDKEFFLNASAQPSAKRVTPPISVDKWIADKHKYPNIMGIVANLVQEEFSLDAIDWTVAAFCENECRGVSQTVNSVLMMNIYGIGSEQIKFYALNRKTNKVFDVSETKDFSSDVLGSMKSPLQLHVSINTGIKELESNEQFTNDHFIYDLQGRRLTDMLTPINHLKKGVYIVIDKNHSKNRKIIRK